MKKTAVIIFSLVVFISFSCKKDYKFYGFYIKKKVEFTIPANATGNFEYSQPIDLNIDKIFEKEDTKASLVQEITIEELTIDGSSYSYFNGNEFKVFISSGNTSEELLASNESVSTSSGTVKLQVSENMMTEHVKASKINIITKGTLYTSPDSEVKAVYNIRFKVKTYVK